MICMRAKKTIRVFFNSKAHNMKKIWSSQGSYFENMTMENWSIQCE